MSVKGRRLSYSVGGHASPIHPPKVLFRSVTACWPPSMSSYSRTTLIIRSRLSESWNDISVVVTPSLLLVLIIFHSFHPRFLPRNSIRYGDFVYCVCKLQIYRYIYVLCLVAIVACWKISCFIFTSIARKFSRKRKKLYRKRYFFFQYFYVYFIFSFASF